jgi:hypothetical protein
MWEIAFGCLSGATQKTCGWFNRIYEAGMTVCAAVPRQMADEV